MSDYEYEDNEDSEDNSIIVVKDKIIFVGDSFTGKSSIINRIVDDPFNDTYEDSIGVDFKTKIIRFRDMMLKIQIGDSAGQEKFKCLIPSYVRNSSIVFFVYDISERSSFDNILKWISFVKNIEKTTMILCGNKTDLPRDVQKNEGEELAKSEGLLFFECSAKTNENIKNMFYSAISVLPTFGDNDEFKRGSLIKELLEENEGKDFQEISYNINEEKINKITNTQIDKIKIKEDKKYNELLYQLNEEKNKNKKLSEQLSNEQKKVRELSDKIKLYEYKIKEYEKKVYSHNLEINNLNNNNEIKYIKPGEKILAIFFTSNQQDIHRPISCKNTDTFVKIEEQIYNEYPKYKDYNTYLTVNGNVIKRFKTLNENGIKDGNTIIVNIYDE